MQVLQLGNGGAFDYDQVNSSFLINIGDDEHPDYILFDCGSSVYSELRRLEIELKSDIIKNIKYVWISHLDDDHIGSLKTLLYYRYFMLNETTSIIYNSVSFDLAQYLKNINYKKQFGDNVQANIVKFVTLIIHNKVEYDYAEVLGKHHVTSCGLLLGKIKERGISNYVLSPMINKLNKTSSSNTTLSNILYISSDTQVNANTYEVLNTLNDIYKDAEYKGCLIFHDYSNWDSYDQQTHTCEYDFNKYYSNLKNIEINKYHNSEVKKFEWVIIDEIQDESKYFVIRNNSYLQMLDSQTLNDCYALVDEKQSNK